MNKKIIIAFALFISFTLLIGSLLLFVSAQRKINSLEKLDITNIDTYSTNELKEYILNKPVKSNYLFYILPISSFTGLFIGILIYYILCNKVENVIKSKNKLLLNLLNNAERKVIEKIINHEGRIRQYELTYIEGLNKMKIHRIIQKLEDNNIIKKEKLGKVNNIILNKEIYNYFKKND